MKMPMMDRRRIRADQILAAVLHAIEPFVKDGEMNDAARSLTALLRTEGAEIVTDAMRADAGLPPRGPDGWTADELRAVEAHRLSLMLQPLQQARIDEALRKATP